MKKYLILILLILTSFYFTCCQKNKNLETVVVKIPSAVCSECEKNIKKILHSDLIGINEVEIDLEQKIATIRYNPDQTNVETIEITITRAGYDANDRKRDPLAYDDLPECCKQHDN